MRASMRDCASVAYALSLGSAVFGGVTVFDGTGLGEAVSSGCCRGVRDERSDAARVVCSGARS
eukprot:6152024-Pleurochrysis_carterae.AAC.1